MDLKQINKQIAEVANRLPVNLCKQQAFDLNVEAITALQQGVLNSSNLIESINSVVKLLAEEVQNLRDEVAELKGERAKPKIRPQTPSDDNDDDSNDPQNSNKNISSEGERKTDKEPKQRRTNADIVITKTEKLAIDKSILPKDAVFKGYQSYIIQDISLELNNIEYLREEYYSATNKCSYVADMPFDPDSSRFGNNIKTLIITLYHQGKMSQPAIHEFLTTFGIQIAKSSISRRLTDNNEEFHKEKAEIVAAGLSESIYAHFDDTGARVNGQNHYVHVLYSPYFTAYFTRKHKDRLTVLEILGQGIVSHVFDESTDTLMQEMGISHKLMLELKGKFNARMTISELTKLLDELLPNSHATAKKQIIESSAIIAYQQLPQAIQILVCDDAPQFKHITELLALCWVHAARHYKKLTPIIPEHKKHLEDFIEKIWGYYHMLREYQITPRVESNELLSLEFDKLFSTVTGYTELDERIAKTKSQKDNLLVVLKHPDVPLHNNPAELGARVQARKRDVSFQTKNAKGTQAKDTFMTVVQTALKLKVNVFAYIRDRVSKTMEMQPLADIIRQKSQCCRPIMAIRLKLKGPVDGIYIRYGTM